MYDFDTSTTLNHQSDYKPNNEKPIFKINDVLQPPKDQDLRHMRHHVRCQDLNEVMGYNPQVCQEIITNAPKNGLGHRQNLKIDNIVEKNTQVTIGRNSSIDDFNTYQLDMLVYTYPYHTQHE